MTYKPRKGDFVKIAELHPADAFYGTIKAGTTGHVIRAWPSTVQEGFWRIQLDRAGSAVPLFFRAARIALLHRKEDTVPSFRVTIKYADGVYTGTVDAKDARRALQLARIDARMLGPGRTFFGAELSHTVEEIHDDGN